MSEAQKMIRVFSALVVVLIAACFSLEACESPPPSHTAVTKVSDPRSLTALISVDGSSTMVALIKAWTVEFKKLNTDVPVSITSNDSGGGIASLINRNTDIALSSRDLTESESALAHSKGIEIQRFTVARDAIAFIVNPLNPVDVMKVDQLEKIYSGQINNWNELGGKSVPINRLSREKASGTFAYFKEHVMHGKDCSSSTKLIPSVAQTIEKVSTDPSAIGYVGLHHALEAKLKVKILALKLVDAATGVKPSAVSSVDDYPLSRPLLIFADQNPKSSTKKFIEFCMGSEGQKLVSKTGYIPIKQ
jgi:phosphate transport system substrate-binding protein